MEPALTYLSLTEICQGDSGSWVIDRRTLEVYGHVIASDKFGDAYVIPIHDTLSDVKVQLGAASVDLLSSADVAFLRLRNQAKLPSSPFKVSHKAPNQTDLQLADD